MGIGALIGGSILSSVVGGATSLAGASAQANAANRAAEAQLQAARESNALQREIYYDSRGLQEPWRVTGANALAEMAALMGLPAYTPSANIGQPPSTSPDPLAPGGTNTGMLQEGQTYIPADGGGWRVMGADGNFLRHSATEPTLYDPNAPTPANVPAPPPANTNTPPPNALATMEAAHERFRATPGYTFMQEEGNNAIERMASARGMRLSGDTLREGARFNSGLADSTFGDYWNRLGGLAGVGQTATNTIGALGQNYANAANSNTMNANALAGQAWQNAGRARASGYTGINNAFQSGMNNMFNIWGMQQAGFI